MSHVKAGGTAKNVHDSPGQRLGVKLYGGQKVKTGMVIVRQVGMTKRAGPGTFLSRNFTIHAKRDGIVTYKTRQVRTFSFVARPRLREEVTKCDKICESRCQFNRETLYKARCYT